MARRRRQESWNEWFKDAGEAPFTAEEVEAAWREFDGAAQRRADTT